MCIIIYTYNSDTKMYTYMKDWKGEWIDPFCNNCNDYSLVKSLWAESCINEYELVLEWTVRCSWTVKFFVMFDMFDVQFLAKMWYSEVFKVRSCCYVTRLVLEPTVWCSQTVHFFVIFDMFEVRLWAKMWCSESSKFRHSMFGVFEVQYFGVHSKTTFYYTEIVTQKDDLYIISLLKRLQTTISCQNSSIEIIAICNTYLSVQVYQ